MLTDMRGYLYVHQDSLAHLSDQDQVWPGSCQSSDATDAGSVAHTQQEAFAHPRPLLLHVAQLLQLHLAADVLGLDSYDTQFILVDTIKRLRSSFESTSVDSPGPGGLSCAVGLTTFPPPIGPSDETFCSDNMLSSELLCVSFSSFSSVRKQILSQLTLAES